MSRHNTCIFAKSKFLYTDVYIALCNGSWTPSANVSLADVYSTRIVDIYPGPNTNLENISYDLEFSFTSPNSNQIVNRIVLLKKDLTVDYSEAYRNVSFIPPSSINVNTIYNDVMRFGDKLYNPDDGVVYTIEYTDDYNSEVVPSFTQSDLDVDIIRIGDAIILHTEAINPITFTGQQITFKWSIDNGNSST